MAIGPVLRLLCDSKYSSSRLTDARGMAPFWRRGEDLSIELALSTSDDYLVKADIGTITVAIKALDAVEATASLLEKQYFAVDCSATYTGSADWLSGDDQLLSVTIDRDEVSFAVGTYRLMVIHEDGSANRQVHAVTEIEVKEDYWENPSLSTPPSPTIEYYNKIESDARFEPINETLSFENSQALNSTQKDQLASNWPEAVSGFITPTGLVGDGVADDTAVIQAALDTSKPVYLPPGDYRITSALLYKHTGQRLSGAGPDLTYIRVAATDHNAIQLDKPVSNNIRDTKTSNLTIIGPGYASSGSGQCGIYMQDPDNLLTLISAYNVMDRVHIAEFDIGLYSHQNPGLLMTNSMVIACNTAVDLAGVDFAQFDNTNLHSWGTMGTAFYNHPGGLLLNIRTAESGASNAGSGFSVEFRGGEMTRCSRAVRATGSLLTVKGTNMEGANQGSVDNGVTLVPNGDDLFYLSDGARLVMDSVRFIGADATTSTTDWTTRSIVRMLISGLNDPSVVWRGIFRNELIGWEVVTMEGTTYNGTVINLTPAKIDIYRYDANTANGGGGVLLSRLPAVAWWNRTQEEMNIAASANTDAALTAANERGQMISISQKDGEAKDDRLMHVIKQADDTLRRVDILNTSATNTIGADVSNRTTASGTLEYHTIADIPRYLIKKEAANEGERLVVEVWGKFAATANAKVVSLATSLGGAAEVPIFTSTSTTASNVSWSMRTEIVSLGNSTAQRMITHFYHGTSSEVIHSASTSIDYTDASLYSLKVGLDGVAAGDITLYSTRVTFEQSPRKY